MKPTPMDVWGIVWHRVDAFNSFRLMGGVYLLSPLGMLQYSEDAPGLYNLMNWQAKAGSFSIIF